MGIIQELAASLFAIDSIWSVVIRGIIWMIVSLLILVATDTPDSEQSSTDVKSYLGSFLMFIVISTSLVYLLFGFAPR